MVAFSGNLWPRQDTLRLVSFLEARSLQPAIAASRSSKGQLQDTLAALRKVEANPDPGALEVFELQQGLRDLETVLAEAQQVIPQATLGNAACGWDAAWQELSSLETKLETAMRYVYGPDWEIKPGKLVSKKGTWLKSSARFSWELSEAKGEKMYLPAGVAMPILQIGRVVDQEELKLHDWVCQHLRVWMKPEIVRTIQARYGIWFVYWPHFEDRGLDLAIVPTVDTWLKRSCQMSGELQPSELIYVPRGVPIHLAKRVHLVDEDWERARHQHVHLHRKVTLASTPVTVKQEGYDILMGQRDNPVPLQLQP